MKLNEIEQKFLQLLSGIELDPTKCDARVYVKENSYFTLTVTHVAFDDKGNLQIICKNHEYTIVIDE